MSIPRFIKNSAAATAVAATVLAGAVVTSAPAQAAPDYVAYYAAVAADYRAHTGRAMLYNSTTVKNAGAYCNRAIVDRHVAFDGAAWITAGQYYGGNLALARATCAQALRFNIR